VIFRPVVEQLESNARVRADSPAYLDRTRTLTWREADERARAMAGVLRGLGAGRGTRIAVLLANTVESAVLLHAVWRVGATGVVINPNIDFSAVLQQVATAGAAVILYDAAHATLADSVVQATGLPAAGDLLGAPSAAEDFPVADGADFAVVSFTSGTTGTPKGTVIPYESLPVRGGAYAVAGGLCHKDRGLITTPLCMAGSLNLAFLPYLYSGASSVLTDQTKGEAVVDLIENHGVTTMFAVPLVSRRIAEAATPERLASLRFILSSGAELPADLQHDLVALGIDVHEAAGTSESAGGIYMTQTQRACRPRSVGVAMPGCRVEIRDPATEERLPDGVSGEIVLAGPIVGHGYLQADGGIEPFPADGTRSGDLGHRDEDGFFFVTGRLKDTIVTGGQNVHPVDVEEVLRGLPEVRDVVVVGCPDAQWGEVVSAVVIPLHAALTVDAVIGFARSRLAPYQVPKQVALVDAFPYTSMGKLDRKGLKSGCADLHWSRGDGRTSS
jgi:fatty-acyl-CoA synthase